MKTKQELVDLVIESLKEDFTFNDYTVLEEILKQLPNDVLVASLPDNIQNELAKTD